ncbi:methionine adenosyltransferase 2 subunit beta isoform X2 [Syngnathoides biaculeatus]|uniref:methionine adenosyltransferase 2 subunit beta isoform X2 n=1 Tax=Syngnathoides biaculeatus TaxID=300417 RepID=UPI002ADE5F80|nr:methionine adenosyltransferase 2 subunit beta isoform X2 [Syngnathoides biaculeatus]XP_061660415.1 methionine adenosyltransferase 2 subunit beta isoform X2 [Syngnathoides biaculeatus]
MSHLTIDFRPGHVKLLQQEDPPAGGLRVLVTGASGLLGRAVFQEFVKRGCAATGTAYRRAGPRLLRCDLTDEDSVKALMSRCEPDAVVHCAAERRPDVVERHPEAADDINVHATAALAREAARRGSFMLYMSSDYVFDGRRPPYGQDDVPNPLNAYGRSKLEGERQTLRHCARSAVLRVPVLFGEVESLSESAVTSLWPGILRAGESCALDHCQQRFPTHTRDVAAVCWNLCNAAARDESIRGMFHYSGKEQMTKYEMALAMARAFDLPSGHLVPLMELPATTGALRPLDSRLDCSRLEVLGLGVEPRAFASAVADCLWPFTPDKRWRQTVFH